MPVINNKTITQRLFEVTVHDGGSVSVTIEFLVEGFPPTYKTFTISQQDALPIWMAKPSGENSRWEDLCGILYQILVDRGNLVGEIV